MRFLPRCPHQPHKESHCSAQQKKNPKLTPGYKHGCLALWREAFLYGPKHSNTETWFLLPHTLNICLGHSQRNSYTHCPAIARHSGSAIDKDQRSDMRMGKGIRQQESEKPGLHFLFCTGLPGSLGALPGATVSQTPALGVTLVGL